MGAFVLGAATTGQHNTGVGVFSLGALSSGASNTTLGIASLDSLTTGSSNTGIGANALPVLASGDNNIALGSQAGAVITSGSNNIYIGSGAGAAAENGTIRIGDASQAAAFIAGVAGQDVDGASDRPVLIDITGKLEPVSFRYRPNQHRGNSLQYGLIAEQVAAVIPELVIHGAEGRPLTVKYHVLPTLLLAEIQRLERERGELSRQLQELRERVDTMERDRR